MHYYLATKIDKVFYSLNYKKLPWKTMPMAHNIKINLLRVENWQPMPTERTDILLTSDSKQNDIYWFCK